MMKFNHGDLSRLSEVTGISVQRICDYLSGRKTPDFQKAAKLALSANELLGLKSGPHDWVFPMNSNNYVIKNYYKTHKGGRK